MAFDPLVVLTGDFKMGASSGAATSYKAEISSVEIDEQRATVVVPATFATGAEGKKAGAYSATVTINVIGDVQATSLYTYLRGCVQNGTPAYFEGLLKPGVVGVTNPKYSGMCAVVDAKIGAASGGLSQFSVTLPVDGLVTSATS